MGRVLKLVGFIVGIFGALVALAMLCGTYLNRGRPK